MPDPFLVEFGSRLRRCREALGVSQAAVAQQIGMHRTHFLRLEHGQLSRMHLWQLAQLAQILRTTVDYLLQVTDHAERG